MRLLLLLLLLLATPAAAGPSLTDTHLSSSNWTLTVRASADAVPRDESGVTVLEDPGTGRLWRFMHMQAMHLPAGPHEDVDAMVAGLMKSDAVETTDRTVAGRVGRRARFDTPKLAPQHACYVWVEDGFLLAILTAEGDVDAVFDPACESMAPKRALVQETPSQEGLTLPATHEVLFRKPKTARSQVFVVPALSQVGLQQRLITETRFDRPLEELKAEFVPAHADHSEPLELPWARGWLHRSTSKHGTIAVTATLIDKTSFWQIGLSLLGPTQGEVGLEWLRGALKGAEVKQP